MFLRRKIPEDKGKEKEEEKFDLERMSKILLVLPESFPYLKGILDSCIRSVSVERFSLDVTVGLGSPADTAAVSGYLWSIASIVNVFPSANLSVKPDFQEEQLNGSLDLNVKFRLLWIVGSFIRAFSKKPVRQLFREMRR